MRDKYYYIYSQKNLSLGKIDKVKEILHHWDVANTNYRGVLWKTAIMYEIGLKNEVLSLLQESLSLLKQRILYSDVEKDALLSYKTVIERHIAIFSEQRFEAREERCDFSDTYNYFLKEYQEHKDCKKDEKVREEHGFAINSM